jgi:Nitrile hydratase, alpha chain
MKAPLSRLERASVRCEATTPGGYIMDTKARAKEQGKKMGHVIVKAWTDEVFKQRLLTNPMQVLQEEGVEVPKGMEVRAVENTEKVFNLVIPQKPRIQELTAEEIRISDRWTNMADHPTCDLFGRRVNY